MIYNILTLIPQKIFCSKVRAERETHPCQIKQLSPNLFIATEEQLNDVSFCHTNTIFFDMKMVSVMIIILSKVHFLPCSHAQIFSEKKLQTTLNCVQVAQKEKSWTAVYYNNVNGVTTSDVQSVCCCNSATNNRLVTVCELQKCEGQDAILCILSWHIYL